jgi:hypothetical protein
MRAMRTRWDIFCTVIDNYGDIGIAWRLARGLAREHGLDVRLWVDDLQAFRHIWPAIDPSADAQSCEGVTVCAWRTPFGAPEPAQVVIDAFGCALPDAYLDAMSAQSPPPVWINLEYLSAEPWVAEHHGLPSPHPRLPLTRYFFFPGYTADTGGLLAEADLAARRAAFVQERNALRSGASLGWTRRRRMNCGCRCSPTRIRPCPICSTPGRPTRGPSPAWFRKAGSFRNWRRGCRFPACRRARCISAGPCGCMSCRLWIRTATTSCCGRAI